MIAHVSNPPKQTLLTRVIHEYLGHGSYCEYTENGRRTIGFEQELKNLEKEMKEIKKDVGKMEDVFKKGNEEDAADFLRRFSKGK